MRLRIEHPIYFLPASSAACFLFIARIFLNTLSSLA